MLCFGFGNTSRFPRATCRPSLTTPVPAHSWSGPSSLKICIYLLYSHFQLTTKMDSCRINAALLEASSYIHLKSKICHGRCSPFHSHRRSPSATVPHPRKALGDLMVDSNLLLSYICHVFTQQYQRCRFLILFLQIDLTCTVLLLMQACAYLF